jgi:hypothetical protein
MLEVNGTHVVVVILITGATLSVWGIWGTWGIPVNHSPYSPCRGYTPFTHSCNGSLSFSFVKGRLA